MDPNKIFIKILLVYVQNLIRNVIFLLNLQINITK